MLINLIAVYVILQSEVKLQEQKEMQKSLAVSGKIKVFVRDILTTYKTPLHEADITGKSGFKLI